MALSNPEIRLSFGENLARFHMADVCLQDGRQFLVLTISEGDAVQMVRFGLGEAMDLRSAVDRAVDSMEEVQ